MTATDVPEERVPTLAAETFETMMRVDLACEQWPRRPDAGPQAQPDAIGPVAMFVALAAHNLCADPLTAAAPHDDAYAPEQAADDAEQLLDRWTEVPAGNETQNSVVTSLLPQLIDVAREVRRYVDSER